ncbi:MAG: hypothetical protein N2C14_08035, partial [Planctomycetales bacterium]
MRQPPKIGTTLEKTIQVEPSHAIGFDGMPAAWATPWLIWVLEHAAKDAMAPFLDEGESSVGTHVDLDHLAPTPVGHAVTCRVKVINVEGVIV